MSGYEELIGGAQSETPEAETPPAAAPAPVQETPAPAPAEAAPAAVETPPAAAPAAPEPQDHSVPLNVLLRTREEFGGKLSQAEARARAAEARLAEIDRKANEAAAQMPDPLDNPQGFARWLAQKQDAAVKNAYANWQADSDARNEAISRNYMRRNLGAEKFGELQKFIDAAPDHAHDAARRSGDPYGWMFEKYEQAMEQRKATEAAKQLDGRSLEDIRKEAAEKAVAEARAQWEAEHAAPAEPSTPARPRNADGTFAPIPQPERHEPGPLAAVNGAATPRGSEAAGGYESLFKRG